MGSGASLVLVSEEDFSTVKDEQIQCPGHGKFKSRRGSEEKRRTTVA